MTMIAKDITDEDFEERFLSAKGYKLLYFWKTNADTCQFGARVLEQMIPTLGVSVALFRVDVEKNPLTAERCGVVATPAYIMFKDGRLVEIKTGLLQGKIARKWLEDVIGSSEMNGPLGGSIRSATRFGGRTLCPFPSGLKSG